MRPVALAGILASTTILGGCAATIGGISLSSISSFAGFASTLFTGADLGEHAASLITGKDCRFSEGLLRDDRDICEEPGSLATRDDFHGIFIDRIDPDGTVIYAAPKYMSASVGAGENENDPDKIWAEIKTQKAKEETERQLARANATQTIDVAALATGSLSPEALAFLPAGGNADVVDGDTASQPAVAPRGVVNAARKSRVAAQPQAPAPAPVQTQAPIAKTPEVGPITDQPAIDEKTFAEQLRPLKANGSGGPLITSAASSAPVTSKIVNGEPVVILRIGPIASTGMAASAQPAAAMTAELSTVPTTTLIAQPSMQPASIPSPQAIVALTPRSDTKQSTLEVAKLEPQMPNARPRQKPRVDLTAAAPREVAAVETMEEIGTTPAPATELLNAKTKKRATTQADLPADVDIYRPPVQTKSAAASDRVNAPYRPADAAYSPVTAPADVPVPQQPEPQPQPQQELPAAAAAFAGSEEAAPPATTGPAQLVPAPQE